MVEIASVAKSAPSQWQPALPIHLKYLVSNYLEALFFHIDQCSPVPVNWCSSNRSNLHWSVISCIGWSWPISDLLYRLILTDQWSPVSVSGLLYRSILTDMILTDKIWTTTTVHLITSPYLNRWLLIPNPCAPSAGYRVIFSVWSPSNCFRLFFYETIPRSGPENSSCSSSFFFQTTRHPAIRIE